MATFHYLQTAMYSNDSAVILAIIAIVAMLFGAKTVLATIGNLFAWILGLLGETFKQLGVLAALVVGIFAVLALISV